MDLFRVRLNWVDHYQASPARFDPQLHRNVVDSDVNNEPKVPVIRVFGTTETGQKVCAHIHGAFPYLYIDYNGQITSDEVSAYIHRLHLSIDHALAVSYRGSVYDRKASFVARITLVKGIPFYGYHVGFQYYLKIYSLDPMVMTRLSDLLRQGAIMKRVFQPYEAHLQYIMQWMVDYNLYGCGYIDSQRVYFREPVPKYVDLDRLSHLWHDRSIPHEYVVREVELPRMSHCSIEVDIMVQDILNRLEIVERPLHHDFVERLNSLPPDQKLVHSMSELWQDEAKRRKANMEDAEPGTSAFSPEALVSMSADPRNFRKGGWVHEEEYIELVHNKIQRERDEGDGSNLSFDTYIKPKPFEDSVNTTFQSVEDFYPNYLGPILSLIPEGGVKLGKDRLKPGDIEVDEKRILNVPDEELPYDSDGNVIYEIEKSDERENSIDLSVAEISRVFDDERTLDADSLPLSNEPILHVDGASYAPAARGDGEFSTNIRNYQHKRDATLMPAREVASSEVASGLLQNRNPPPSLRESNSTGLKRSTSLMSSNQMDNKRLKLNAASFETMMDNKDYGNSIVSEIGQPSLSTVNGLSHRPNLRQKHIPSDHGSRKLDARPLPIPAVIEPHKTTAFKLSQRGSPQSLKGTSPPHNKMGLLGATPHSLQTLGNSNTHCVTPSYNQQSDIISNIFRYLRRTNWVTQSKTLLAFAEPPQAREIVMSSLHPPIIYQGPYYSNELDVPERPTEWAGKEFKLESLTAPFLSDFDKTGSSAASIGEKPVGIYNKLNEGYMYEHRQKRCRLRVWEIGNSPPTWINVEAWEHEKTSTIELSKVLKSVTHTEQELETKHSQIEGPTQKNQHGFKYTQPQKTPNVYQHTQNMSLMSLELHINTRGNLAPNPQEDEVQCVFWSLQLEETFPNYAGIEAVSGAGIVVLSEDGQMARNIAKQTSTQVLEENSELDLLIRIVEIVRTYDPDILTGYEVHSGSWGYLVERAKLKYEYNLCDELSRVRSHSHGRFEKDSNKWGFRRTSTIVITGRHIINIWRAMRNELGLLKYTLENVVFHLLHRRIPHYSWQDLTMWYTNGNFRDLAKVIDYYLCRSQLDLAILDQNELITRTSEQARLLGVDFFSVLSRGSQFKVESLMFRIAKPENFVLVSPSRKQVGGQNALECLPLVMEPQSAFYSSPLLVLDFQSLYPSVMIAYNYCYSTFLGRIVNWRGVNKMGFAEYKRQNRLLELLKDHINISPNGMMYTKPEIRKSLLAKMLGEILETRVMVKSGMKDDVNDKVLQKLLNNRQLALKLIANVTYGYTSASFSGRMPCVEIADSIVQSARETLEKAIALVHSVKRWGAEVVYGDTDSIFIYLKGRTKDQAFDIGNEIAKSITSMNPQPVKLKFEKVYLPCVLLAKKRYVGFKYEKRDQLEPEFDAKGIETVRRDGTPAEQKIEEKALKILFRSADLSQVKQYFQAQCEKIMKGSVSIQDFCFSKEVRLGTYSDKRPPPPGALISMKRMLEDHRAEPQHGERVPYVVITGAPGARLIDRCVAPETLLQSDHNELDSEYYILKNLIPPLERIFSLVGANVRSWYDEMPKIQRVRRVDVDTQLPKEPKDLPFSKKTLESYMRSSSCLVCRDKLETDAAICPSCLGNRSSSMLSLQTRLAAIERKSQALEKVCRSCSNLAWADDVRCDSKDCPVFYSRVKEKTRLTTERKLVGPLMEMLHEDSNEHKDLVW